MLKAGYARLDTTPPLGLPIDGYYKERFVEGVLDPLEVCCLALDCNGEKALIIAMDICEIDTLQCEAWRKRIEAKTGVPYNGIYIGATHSHTCAAVRLNVEGERTEAYRVWIGDRLEEVAVLAVEDLKEAKMGWGIGTAPNISFIRRFRMKDGSVATNPGANNPDIVAPIGEVDDRVNVVRFDRENADTIVFVNFADHPDVVGGSKVSADWPGMARRQVELSLPGTKCLVLNGAQGDINHVNVHPKDGDHNGMFNDFDDVMRGYAHAIYMGRVVAGGVMQAYDKVKYCDVDKIVSLTRTVQIPSNMPTKEELVTAYKYDELHKAGKDDEIPFKGMMLTTVVAEAERMINLENGPESFPFTLTGIRLGPVAFVGIPGEPFNGVGLGIKEAEGYDLIITTCITNGYEGYFPMKDSYDEGGYEARSSIFASGCAEIIVEEGKNLLSQIK